MNSKNMKPHITVYRCTFNYLPILKLHIIEIKSKLVVHDKIQRLKYNYYHLLFDVRKRSLAVWNINKRLKCEYLLDSLSFSITCIAIRFNFAMFGCNDNKIRVYEILPSDLKLIKIFAAHNKILRCLTIINHYLISSSNSKTIKVWNTDKDYAFVKSIDVHSMPILCIVCYKELLISGSVDTKINIFDSNNAFNLTKTLDRHKGTVSCLQVNGIYLYSGSSDGSIIMWNIINGFSFVEYVLLNKSPIVFMHYHESNTLVTNEGSEILLLSLKSGEKKEYRTIHSIKAQTSTMKNDKIYIALDDCSIKILQLKPDKYYLSTMIQGNKNKSILLLY